MSWRIGVLDVELDDEAAKNTGDDQLHCLIQKHAALYKPYVDRNVAPDLVQIFIEDDQFEVPCECKVQVVFLRVAHTGDLSVHKILFRHLFLSAFLFLVCDYLGALVSTSLKSLCSAVKVEIDIEQSLTSFWVPHVDCFFVERGEDSDREVLIGWIIRYLRCVWIEKDALREL